MDSSIKAMYEAHAILSESLPRDIWLDSLVDQVKWLTEKELKQVFGMTPMMPIDLLTQKINEWHDARKIVPNSSAAVQTLKAMSEMGELADNIAKGKPVIDDIGDVYVCLCSIARLSGYSMNECIEYAYNDIKDRTGTLLPNGNFVKDA